MHAAQLFSLCGFIQELLKCPEHTHSQSAHPAQHSTNQTMLLGLFHSFSAAQHPSPTQPGPRTGRRPPSVWEMRAQQGSACREQRFTSSLQRPAPKRTCHNAHAIPQLTILPSQLISIFIPQPNHSPKSQLNNQLCRKAGISDSCAGKSGPKITLNLLKSLFGTTPSFTASIVACCTWAAPSTAQP